MQILILIYLSIIMIASPIYALPIDTQQKPDNDKANEVKLFLLEKRALALQHGTHGIQLCEEKKFEEAIEDLDKAILLDPDRATFYSIRSTAYIGLGKLEKGLADINHAIAIDPQDVDFYGVRATAHFLQGQIKEGMSDLITCAKMGEKTAQETLQKIGIPWE